MAMLTADTIRKIIEGTLAEAERGNEKFAVDVVERVMNQQAPASSKPLKTDKSDGS